jgi:rhodanese-related sulfurtransferase
MLKKILILIITLTSILNSTIIKTQLTEKLIKEKIPIVDIRTNEEWKQTGIVKNAITITAWYSNGKIYINDFLKELNEKIDTSKPFAMYCRTGHRTSKLANFLSKKLNYTIYDIKGGILKINKKYIEKY